jgi:hypothetical protein
MSVIFEFVMLQCYVKGMVGERTVIDALYLSRSISG